MIWELQAQSQKGKSRIWSTTIIQFVCNIADPVPVCLPRVHLCGMVMCMRDCATWKRLIQKPIPILALGPPPAHRTVT